MTEKASNASKVVPIRRKFVGKRWDELTNLLTESDDENQVTDQEAFVHRLGVCDMGLYGLFPETDRFCAVVCECGSIIKPQGLKNHLARHHTSGSSSSVYSGNGGSFNHSSSNSPASSTSSTPVKNTEDFSGIIPIQRSGKHKHGSKLKSTKISKSNLYSSSSQPPLILDKNQPLTHTSMPDFVVNATSNSLDSTTAYAGKTSHNPNPSGVPQSTKGSSKKSKHHKHKSGRGAIEFAGYDPNRHCGVFIQEMGQPCLNALSCRDHTLSQRRQVKGRIGSFDSLLAEHSHFEIESNSSSCSSILEKPNLEPSNEELNNLIKNHIEMPTIVLRKIDEEIKGLHEPISINSLPIVTKLEPIVMEAEQILNEIPPAELAQLLQQQAGNIQQDDDIFLDHQESQMMCSDPIDEKIEMYHPLPATTIDEQQQQQQQQQQHHITCRTVAFPLYLLTKNAAAATAAAAAAAASSNNNNNNNNNMKSEEHHHDQKASSVFVQNMIQLQNFVPLFRDTYCDIFSNFEPNILNDATNIFPTLATVDDHHAGEKLRFDDHRNPKLCMYPSLPKPSHVNTFGMRRIGGGATTSRRSFYLRKTLLKNRENDKKLKLKTDPSGFSTACQPNQHLLTSNSAVSKAKKRSFLANPAQAKMKRLAKESGSSGGVSELNQSTDLSKLTNNFAFSTNNFNHNLDTSPSIDDMMQTKRQVFVPRFS